MAEPTLAAAFKDLQGDVGFFLGYGRGADFSETTWSTGQQSAITRSVKGGLRKFYHCGYDWSFLKPVGEVVLASGASTVQLPDDFGGVDSSATVTATDGTATNWFPVQYTRIGILYQLHSIHSSSTGRPQTCCVEPLKGTGTQQGQRFQLKVWPTADQAYTFQIQYYLNPDYLTGAFPYAYGGAQHAETLLEACLSVAEKILDDKATLHDQEFQRLLQISMMIDRRNKPQNLGYNGDRSDYRSMRRDWRHIPTRTLTVGGVVYTD